MLFFYNAQHDQELIKQSICNHISHMFFPNFAEQAIRYLQALVAESVDLFSDENYADEKLYWLKSAGLWEHQFDSNYAAIKASELDDLNNELERLINLITVAPIFFTNNDTNNQQLEWLIAAGIKSNLHEEELGVHGDNYLCQNMLNRMHDYVINNHIESVACS